MTRGKEILKTLLIILIIIVGLAGAVILARWFWTILPTWLLILLYGLEIVMGVLMVRILIK